jgi:hypothetical protein
MTIPTKPGSFDRSAKLAELKAFHQETLDAAGVPNAYLTGKMCFKPMGRQELCVSLFFSEVSKGDDVYVELTDRELNPEDPKRCLYKFMYNFNFDEEYVKVGETDTVRYLIPFKELILVRDYSANPKIANFVSLEDLPMSDMTMLDYAAIHKWIPVSKKDWLNKVITNNKL